MALRMQTCFVGFVFFLLLRRRCYLQNFLLLLAFFKWRSTEFCHVNESEFADVVRTMKSGNFSRCQCEHTLNLHINENKCV